MIGNIRTDRVISAEYKRNRGMSRFLMPFLSSRYFIVALSVHLIILFFWGSLVLVEYTPIQSMFDNVEQGLIAFPDPPPQLEITTPGPDAKPEQPVTLLPGNNVKRIASISSGPFIDIDMPTVAPVLNMKDILPEDRGLKKKINEATMRHYERVRNFQGGWIVTGSGRNTRATFSIFKAKYRDGDWNCNPSDMENLLLQIRHWSRGRIKASLDPRILDVGTDELFTIKPPFVYLTGHKDFTLLDTEVRNIREYLLSGGAIWADNALAGRRSRFDLAFRREMKKVFPDRDFEPVSDNHEMFDTFFRDIRRPTGMNFYDEPVEVINIRNKLAVIYTLNGYGHYWEARLNDQGNIEYGLVNTGTDETPVFRYVNGPHAPHGGGGWWRRTIYRNYDDEQVRNSYKFGINVVVHLLTRYQEEFRLLPLQLPSAQQSLRLE